MQFESLDQALQLRRLLEMQAENLTDEKAIGVACFTQRWRPGIAYREGDRVGIPLDKNITLYRCLQSHVSQDPWIPTAAPSLWSKVLIPDASVVPAWEQPESTNPYQKGDQVSHNNKTWESDLDNNVWEPGVHGWTEVKKI